MMITLFVETHLAFVFLFLLSENVFSRHAVEFKITKCGVSTLCVLVITCCMVRVIEVVNFIAPADLFPPEEMFS